MNRLPPAVRPASEHLLGAAMVAFAAVPWIAVTGRPVAVVELGAAIVGASLVSIAASRSRRVPVAGEVLMSAAGLAVLLLWVVVGDPLGGGEVLRGLRDGVPRLLSTSLPMIDVTWAGVPGATIVWSAAAVVASTVARTRSVAGPVLAVIVTFLAGYALTLGGRTGDVAATALPEVLFLGLVTGAFALTRSFHGLPDEEPGVLALRVSTAVMTLVVALGAGAAAAARGPFVPEEPVRPRLEPVVTELEPEGPLLVTRRLREEEPDRTVAIVSVSQDWAGYLPYAVLDRFDGRSWSRADDRLTPTGGVVPVTLPAPSGPEVVVRDLDVAATGGWLPYVGRVASLSGVSVLQAEGEVFRLAEPAPSTTYRLRSAQPSTTVRDDGLSWDQPTARSSGLVRGLEVAQLATDPRTAGERVCRLLALTAGSEAETGSGELGLLGSPCARRGPDQLAFVRGLADELAAGRAVEITTDEGGSTAGPESLADLLELVGPPSPDGRSTGAPEQFAAAYALVADAYGLPVRLVTGFRIEEPEVDAPRELRGEDAWTWAEVAVEGAGWVVVDPTPSAEDLTEEELLERPDLIDQPDPTPQEAPAELGVEAERLVVGPPAPPEDRSEAPLVVVALALVAAAVLLPLLVAVSRRRIRRSRRGRGDARQRVVGAWHHLLDTAAELRVPDLESRTSQQIVADLAERAPRGTEGLADLPTTVDRAVFSSAPIDDDDADRAWATVTSARLALRGAVPRRTRVADLWRVPPRSVTTGVRTRRRGGDRRGGARRRGGGRRPGSGQPREVPTLQGAVTRDAARSRG